MSSYHSANELPAPDRDQVAHSSKLIERIVERIEQAGGVIPFRDYMQACLYEPGLGYYAAGASKLGKDGDFITAPEVTSLFGATLANRAAALFAGGLQNSILEFGAGSGKLCVDIINRLNALGSGWQHYWILETSPDLRQRQQAYCHEKLLPDDLKKLEWLDALPSEFDGLVIGNEVLDAMPVNVVVKDNGWCELGVGFDGEKFVWLEYSRDSEAISAMQMIDSDDRLPERYCTEVNLNYRPWCHSLADACGKAVVLLIDYGYTNEQYYHPECNTGTLICYYRHRAHPDPFIYPGLQDITAFVDFDTFGDAVVDAGFSIDRLSTQAEFLLQNGLLEIVQGMEGDEMRQLALAQQVKALTLPGEMGEKFKVIEFST